MKRKIGIILAVVLFLAGLGILLYPSYQMISFRQAEKGAVQEFESYRALAKSIECPPRYDLPAETEDMPEPTAFAETIHMGEPQSFQELWVACVEYNEALAEKHNQVFTKAAWERAALVLPDYGWENKVFGVLTIPSAYIEAPLYLGGSMANLNKGAAILGQTSLPIGGNSSHCVIAGHRTWNAILHPFVGLQDVEVGDIVYLTNPWETLIYRVISIDIISPDNAEKIRIQDGRDLVSVFTCTYPNIRRLLVTCERETKKGD